MLKLTIETAEIVETAETAASLALQKWSAETMNEEYRSNSCKAMDDRAAAEHDAKMRESTDKILALITLPAWLPAILGYAVVEDLPNGKTIISQSPGWLTPCLWLVGWISPIYFLARILLLLPASMAENLEREARKKETAARQAEAESKIPMYRKIATREARKKKREQEFLALVKKMKASS